MKFSVAVAIASTIAFTNAAAVRTVTQIHWVTQAAQQPQPTADANAPVTVTVYANNRPVAVEQPEDQPQQAATTLVTKQANQEAGDAVATEGVQKQAAPAAQSSAPQPLATGSSDDSGSAKGPTEFAQLMLDIHNKLRSKHSLPALQWDDTIAQYAEDYASKFDCSMNLVHSGGKYGENLAVGYSSGPAAVEAWYEEGKEWNYQSTALNHFTQVIWKGASKLGCAVKACQGQGHGYYVTCNYDTGNVIGQSAANVLAN